MLVELACYHLPSLFEPAPVVSSQVALGLELEEEEEEEEEEEDVVPSAPRFHPTTPRLLMAHF